MPKPFAMTVPTLLGAALLALSSSSSAATEGAIAIQPDVLQTDIADIIEPSFLTDPFVVLVDDTFAARSLRIVQRHGGRDLVGLMRSWDLPAELRDVLDPTLVGDEVVVIINQGSLSLETRAVETSLLDPYILDVLPHALLDSPLLSVAYGDGGFAVASQLSSGSTVSIIEPSFVVDPQASDAASVVSIIEPSFHGDPLGSYRVSLVSIIEPSFLVDPLALDPRYADCADPDDCPDPMGANPSYP